VLLNRIAADDVPIGDVVRVRRREVTLTEVSLAETQRR
jgi:hypothetical protein